MGQLPGTRDVWVRDYMPVRRRLCLRLLFPLRHPRAALVHPNPADALDHRQGQLATVIRRRQVFHRRG
ncbi:MAG: hypothetical protein ACRYFV_15435 [Janthinobacterium lividum]